MYSQTPTNKYLVLSPIESGPEASIDEQFSRARSDSYSSIESSVSPSSLPSGFLYLGYPTPAPHVRSDSYSSTEGSTNAKKTNSSPALPSRFLYLGYPAPDTRARSDSSSSTEGSSSAPRSAPPSGFLYLGY